MVNCKNCKREVDKLFDEEMCEICHDIWLNNLLNDTDIMKIVGLNKFKDSIGLGGK